MTCESFMRRTLIAIVLGALAACNAKHSPSVWPTKVERGLFTDSALHAQRCEPLRPGEDWRRVCIPKDQRVEDGVRPKKP